MQPTVVQPNASQIPEELAAELVRCALGPGAEPPAFTLSNHGVFSNDLAEARLRDGRRLMIKRGRTPWSGARFEASRTAARLLRRRADIVTPPSLPLPPGVGECPLDVYWRIELPTLAELWPRLRPDERAQAMRSLGRLIRRAHAVTAAGHGALLAATERRTPLSEVLAEEIGERLMPAVAEGWPEGVPLVEWLLGMVPEAARRARAGGVLVHGDLHAANVLCERANGSIRCVGLLDLECAHWGPRESDLARLSVIQTDLFQMPVEGPWMEWVLEGYGRAMDPVLFGFYAVYHLAHLGCHSAWIGHGEHAGEVAAAARKAAVPPCPSGGA